MISFKENICVYISLEPIDFRKGLNGLLVLTQAVFSQLPQSDHLFLFRDVSGKKLKAVYWDTNGFMLLYKRLETGKFQFPKILSGEMQLDRLQLECLLSGMDFIRKEVKKANEYAVFS